MSPFSQPPEATSRAGRKRALEVIQGLAKELVEMQAGDLAALELADDVREQVENVRRIKSQGARRRQLRFLCNYIANAEHEAIQQTLTRFRAGKRADAKKFQNLESLREKVIAGGPDAIDQVCATLPRCNPKELRKLQLASQRELGKTVAAARALFRYLRQCADE